MQQKEKLVSPEVLPLTGKSLVGISFGDLRFANINKLTHTLIVKDSERISLKYTM